MKPLKRLKATSTRLLQYSTGTVVNFMISESKIGIDKGHLNVVHSAFVCHSNSMINIYVQLC